MANTTLFGTIRSEWLKFRSVRSSITGAIITLALTLGINALVAFAIRSHWPHVHDRHQAFDPSSFATVGVFFAQFAFGVIGALFITSEYSSGSIRTSLTAVPNRAKLIMSKVTVLLKSGLVLAELAVFGGFAVTMSIFHGKVPTASLSDSAVLRSVILAGVYLTLLALLGFGLGLILRQTAICISVFVSLLLILPIVSIFFPTSWKNDLTRFDPSELGNAMMSRFPQPNHFSAYGSAFVLFLYVVVVIGVGLTMFQRRDA